MCACAIFFEQESAAYFSSGDSAAAFAGHKFPGFNEKAVGQSKIYTMRAQGEIWGANNIPNDPLRLAEQCSFDEIDNSGLWSRCARAGDKFLGLERELKAVAGFRMLKKV